MPQPNEPREQNMIRAKQSLLDSNQKVDGKIQDGQGCGGGDEEKAEMGSDKSSVARIVKLINRIRAMLCIPKDEGKG